MISPEASSDHARRTMRANPGKNTGPELTLRRLLREAGFSGYRLHWAVASARPDIAYPGRKIALFVNGCFWHQCPHCHPARPKANAAFWESKFEATMARDSRQYEELRSAGWRVLVVWECDLRDHPESVVARLTNAISGVDGGKCA
jgi:DNA mismatch endonuclease, patch repair protein